MQWLSWAVVKRYAKELAEVSEEEVVIFSTREGYDYCIAKELDRYFPSKDKSAKVTTIIRPFDIVEIGV